MHLRERYEATSTMVAEKKRVMSWTGVCFVDEEPKKGYFGLKTNSFPLLLLYEGFVGSGERSEAFDTHSVAEKGTNYSSYTS